MYKIITQSLVGLKNNPSFQNYFLVPFYSGITGFASFLFIVMLIEYLAHIVGINDSLKLGVTELMVACLGFALQFLYGILQEKKK